MADRDLGSDGGVFRRGGGGGDGGSGGEVMGWPFACPFAWEVSGAQ